MAAHFYCQSWYNNNTPHNTVNDKVLDAGVEVADKVADGTFHIAEKADDVRNKVHTFSDKAKK